MPHAQGTSPGRAAATRTSAKGNGRPMKNASGAISASDTAILSVSGSGISQRNSGGAATRCSTAAATMPATASASAGYRTRTTHRQRPSPPVKRISAPGADNPCNASSRAVNLGAKPLPRPAKKRNAHRQCPAFFQMIRPKIPGGESGWMRASSRGSSAPRLRRRGGDPRGTVMDPRKHAD